MFNNLHNICDTIVPVVLSYQNIYCYNSQFLQLGKIDNEFSLLIVYEHEYVPLDKCMEFFVFTTKTVTTGSYGR